MDSRPEARGRLAQSSRYANDGGEGEDREPRLGVEVRARIENRGWGSKAE